MKIYLATCLVKNQKQILNKVGYIYRLFSFLFLKDEESFLSNYQKEWKKGEKEK